MNARFNIRRNVIFAFSEFLLSALIVFISYRFLADWGGVEAIGLWSTMFAWTMLIRVGDVGMANALVRFVAMHDMNDEAPLVRSYVETGIISNALLFGAWSLIGYCALVLIVPSVVGAANAAEAERVLPVMFLSFFLLNLSGAIMGALQGLHQGYRRAQVGVAGSVLQLVFVLILVPPLGLVGMAWAQVIQYLSTTILSWLLVRRHASIAAALPLSFDAKAFRAMLRYSLTAQVANIANGFFEPVSKILVSFFGGLHAQGLYELAYKTLWLPRNSIVAGTTATMPAMTALYEADRAQLRQLYAKTSRWNAVAVGAVLLAVLACTPLISWIWIGTVSIEYSIFAAILCAGVFLNAVGAPAYNLATATGRMRSNIVVNCGTLILLLILGVSAGVLLSTPWIIAATAAAMAAGGLAIKFLNERMLAE